jgi:hypothetical protein
MKFDILEQLVDGWFLRQPSTFTKHSIKYKPKASDISHLNSKAKSKYTVSSDIDIVAIHLDKEEEKRVSVVSCKSWQGGFDIDYYYQRLIDEEKRKHKDMWKRFRELVEPVWAKAFREKIFDETKSNSFTYYIAATRVQKNKDKFVEDFKSCKLFLDNLSDYGKYNVRINFLTLETMLEQMLEETGDTTLESTEIGRFMQLLRAAGLKLSR